MDLKKRFSQFILNKRLVKRGDLLLVGVSGGADSVCLLHLLYTLRSQLGIRIHVAHFNHRLRPTAMRDELFVKGLADAWSLPISVGRSKKRPASKTSSEEEARSLRYDFFLKSISACRADALVLAHTQNDLVETVLMRLIRGAGLLGLRGILADRDIANCRVIRPLLECAREDIEHYLKIHNLDHCTDETNAQTRYLRNKIRLELIPKLKKEYNPSVSNVLLDLAYNAQADYDYLISQAQRSFKNHALLSKGKVVLGSKALLRQPVALRRMLLRLSYEHLTSGMNELGAIHMQEAEDLMMNRPCGSIVSWPKGVCIHKTLDKIIVKF